MECLRLLHEVLGAEASISVVASATVALPDKGAALSVFAKDLIAKGVGVGCAHACIGTA